MDLMLGFLLAMSVTMALIPPLMHAAARLHFLDLPGHRKVHATPVPRVGGIAMAAGTMLALALSGEFQQPMPAYLAAIGVLLAFGVWDDRVTLSAGMKLVGQLIAVALVMTWGEVTISTTTLTERYLLPEWLSLPLTALFLLGVTNAINLADGLDGLAGGTTLLALSALALLAFTSATPFVGVVADRDHRRHSRVPALQHASRARVHGRRRQPDPGLLGRGARDRAHATGNDSVELGAAAAAARHADHRHVDGDDAADHRTALAVPGGSQSRPPSAAGAGLRSSRSRADHLWSARQPVRRGVVPPVRIRSHDPGAVRGHCLRDDPAAAGRCPLWLALASARVQCAIAVAGRTPDPLAARAAAPAALGAARDGRDDRRVLRCSRAGVPRLEHRHPRHGCSAAAWRLP